MIKWPKNVSLWIGAVLSLSLALGAAATVFGIVDAVLLRPLPYPAQEQIMRVERAQGPQRIGPPVSAPAFLDIARDQDVFAHLGAVSPVPVVLQGGGGAERLLGAEVTGDWFAVMGLPAATGRLLNPGDDAADAPLVAVLSNAEWQRRFGGSPQAIGATLMLDGQAHTIVGVASPDLRLPGGAVLAKSAQLHRADRGRGNNYLLMTGRLKPGVSQEQAQLTMSAIGKRLASAFPDNHAELDFQVRSLVDLVTAGTRDVVGTLGAAIGLLLIVGGASFANLLLARTAARRREFATKAALGASAAQLARQVFGEALLLVGAATIVGLIFGALGLRWMMQVAPPWLPRPETLGLSGTSLIMTLVVASLVLTICAALPAWRAGRGRFADALRAGQRGGLDRAGQRLRRGLVVAQIALSCVLLIGAGLLTESLRRVLEQSPGFDPKGLISLRMNFPEEAVADFGGGDNDEGRAKIARGVALIKRIEADIGAIPGITAAGFTWNVPIVDGSGHNGDYYLASEPVPEPGKYPLVEFQLVTPGYFRAMGISTLAGVALEDNPAIDGEPLVLVNQALADRHADAQRVIGDSVMWSDRNQRIVGVVGDVRQNDLEAKPLPEMYLSAYQLGLLGEMALVVRAQGDAEQTVTQIREAVRRINPAIPVHSVESLDAALTRTTAERRLLMYVMQFFALTALAIAVVGLYAVFADSVAQRTSEFGVRLALGGTRRRVIGTVTREGSRLLLLGLALGLVSALAGASVLSSRLFGVSTWEPMVYLCILILMGIATLVSVLIPAWQASRVQPTQALRYE